jgi:uncharacterized membrane protein
MGYNEEGVTTVEHSPVAAVVRWLPPAALNVASVVWAVVQLVFYSTRLPSGDLPTHFDGEGKPDGWSTKDELLGTYAGAYFGTMAGAFWLLGLLLWRLPVRYMNLSGLQRTDPETAAVAKRVFLVAYAWMAALTGLFLNFVFEMNFQAAMNGKDGQLPQALFWAIFVVYMVGFFVPIVWMMYKLNELKKGVKGAGLLSGGP